MGDPFLVLGVEPKFSLEPEELAARHRELSLEAHPDRLRVEGSSSGARSASHARREALSRAIDVNEAFRRLRDPVLRAESLLERRGATALADGKASADFLLEILELRESLRSAGESGRTDAIAALVANVGRRRGEAEAELGRLFALEEWTEEDRHLLGRRLAELRFFRRFEDEANAYLDVL